MYSNSYIREQEANEEEKEPTREYEDDQDTAKPVVICQHGILDSASCWILNGKRSIAFRLVEQGYDVWLNNSRGNWYSMEHTDYDPKVKGSKAFKKDDQKSQKEDYYDFSFHELGIYDQPALWNYVLKETG